MTSEPVSADQEAQALPTELGEWPRRLRPGQRSQVLVVDAVSGKTRSVLETDEVLLEAPNWTRDGVLLLNGDGLLWSVDLREAHPRMRQVRYTGLPLINNDHVLHPETGWVLMSAADGHIYTAPPTGGRVHRVTPVDGQHHFLHGVSPDGRWLAYVEIPLDDLSVPGQVVQLSLTGAPHRRLDAGGAHCDGPEYSPDGAWVYLNTEAFTQAPGHAQLARFPSAGGELERLLTSDTVDWFPHLSPDGELAAYIAFPAGTLGHPGDVDVEVRVVSTKDWSTPLHVVPLFGGQGTVNVTSWSPDSRRFAVVAHPLTP